MKSTFWLAASLSSSLLLAANGGQAQSTSPASLAFSVGLKGAFTFDTGVLRGVLRADGKSVGLQTVTHIPSGTRLDQSMGLFSHYRVFTTGQRYGNGAWDWPSTAKLTERGAVEVSWPATGQRPFAMRAVYRWSAPATLDLETSVTARQDLSRFESFLASYFTPGFTNALALTRNAAFSNAPPIFLPARCVAGEWQMFPRDEAAVRVIQDGRWQLPPNPVDWAILPRFAQPVAVRRDVTRGLSALVLAQSEDCFALAMPHETEGHCSLYVSQFGCDLKAGETVRARARLVILESVDQRHYLREWAEFNGR